MPAEQDDTARARLAAYRREHPGLHVRRGVLGDLYAIVPLGGGRVGVAHAPDLGALMDKLEADEAA